MDHPASTVPVLFQTVDGIMHKGFFLKDINKHVRGVNKWKDTLHAMWYLDEDVVDWTYYE